jgi:hypothetical protein
MFKEKKSKNNYVVGLPLTAGHVLPHNWRIRISVCVPNDTAPQLSSGVERDKKKQCISNYAVGLQQNNCAIDGYDVMKPAGQERRSAP